MKISETSGNLKSSKGVTFEVFEPWIQILLCEGQVLKNFIEIFGNIQKALLLKYLNLGFKSYPFMRGTGPKKFHRNFWEHSKGVTFEVFEPWVQILSIYARDRI